MMGFLPLGVQVLERGWLSSNNIVFTLGDVTAVVDTGYLNHVPQTLALVDDALQGRPLDRIVNTHLHSDHAGGNAALQARYPGCHTTIPPGLADAVTAWDDVALSYRPTGQQCDRFRHDAVLSIGGRLDLGGHEWTVLPADGHDADMVMLWCEREGVLISADALWQNGFGVLFPELTGDPGAFEAQQRTLDVIAQLDARLVIPGHGAPFADVAQALQTAQSRLSWLREDPRRHAEAALKGLVAFTLLDRQRMPWAAVVGLIGQGLLSQAGFRARLPESTEDLAHWVIAQLTRVGVARWDGQVLEAVV